MTTLLRHGSGATLAQIAEAAGVGTARCTEDPTREDLLEALQLRAFGVIDLVKEIESQDLRGIDAVRTLERTVDHGSQLAMPAHGVPLAPSPEIHRLRGELHGWIARDGGARRARRARSGRI